MTKYKAMIAGVAILAVPALSSAAVVTLNAGGDGFNTSSFDSGLNWSDSTAPSAANDYVVTVEWLRTPTANGSTYTFAGNSLTIGTGGGFIFKSDNSTHNIDNLIMSGGRIWGGNTGGNTGTILNGNITVVGTGSTIWANQSSYTINSAISGAGELTLNGGGGNYLNLAGTISLPGGLFVEHIGNFTSASQINFTIGADGINNDVTGAGTAAFDGTFAFDLTAAGTTVGDSWLVAGVTSQTFGGTFAVSGFADQGDGTWYLNNGAEYSFDTGTGTLSVIPEPATFGLVGLCGAGALFIRRRFMI